MSQSKKDIPARVADLTTKEKLAAIPIAKKGMCPEMLRKICLDFFRLQLSFPWIPSEDFIIGNKKWLASEDPNAPDEIKKLRIFEDDTVCGGLPYVSVGGGTIYRAMEFYDEKTGVLDVSFSTNEPRIFGNACSGSACISWGRVINSARLTFTYAMNQNNGFLRVGPYTYDDSYKHFTPAKEYLKAGNKGYTIKEIVKENGEQVMFESYALLQPADGIASIGHVRMISQYPVVKRLADGTIDGNESYVTYMDQCKPRKVRTQCDGTPIIIQGGVDVKITFKQLFDTAHSCFTFAEFQGLKDVDEAVINFEHNEPSLSLDTIKKTIITANYPFCDVFMEIEKPDGTLLCKTAIRPVVFCLKKIELKEFEISEEIKALEKEGKSRIRLSAQLHNGEKKEFYYGIFSAEKKERTSVVSAPFNKEMLDAIPVATPDMTEDELRKICLDYMRLQLSFSWTPDRDSSYTIERSGKVVSFKKDQVYGGLPYVTKGSGSLYRALEFIDPETGVMDMTEAEKNPRIFGNACSGAACSAWSRVVSSVERFGYTRHMTQKNGFMRVGPYTYPDDIEEFVKPEIDKDWGDTPEYSPENVVAETNLLVLYESYALLKPGDGIVSKDHVRMVSDYPNVIRSSDGYIEGRDSSLRTMDQVTTWKLGQQTDGTPIAVQGGIDVEYSFFTLRKNGYIPFTFKEFTGEAKVQNASLSFSLKGEKISQNDLENASLTSNIAISDVFVTVMKNDGTDRKLALRNDDFSVRNMNFADLVPKNFFADFIQNGEGKIKITCQLFNGEHKTVYEGVIA